MVIPCLDVWLNPERKCSYSYYPRLAYEYIMIALCGTEPYAYIVRRGLRIHNTCRAQSGQILPMQTRGVASASAWFWTCHEDVIKWKHFLRYWPFVRGIRRSPVNSPHKGQWRGALMLSLTCDWINGWLNNREADDLRHHRAHYDNFRDSLTWSLHIITM